MGGDSPAVGACPACTRGNRRIWCRRRVERVRSGPYTRESTDPPVRLRPLRWVRPVHTGIDGSPTTGLGRAPPPARAHGNRRASATTSAAMMMSGPYARESTGLTRIADPADRGRPVRAGIDGTQRFDQSTRGRPAPVRMGIDRLSRVSTLAGMGSGPYARELTDAALRADRPHGVRPVRAGIDAPRPSRGATSSRPARTRGNRRVNAARARSTTVSGPYVRESTADSAPADVDAGVAAVGVGISGPRRRQPVS